jgi:membrane associated rhomboid family serine protease
MFPLSDAHHRANRFPYVNVAIIALNIYAFYLQMTNGDSFTLAYALTPSIVDFSHVSSLVPFVTSMFLHGGFLHIISNMWFLWVFGDNVEGHFPHFIYPVFYIVSGIVAGLSQYILSPGSNIPMLGASGAVAGVLGGYLVYFPRHRIKTLVPFFGFLTVTELPAMLMIGYWFVLQVISGAASLPGTGEEGGVAFFAHIGGFLAGVILAKIFQPMVKEHAYE